MDDVSKYIEFIKDKNKKIKRLSEYQSSIDNLFFLFDYLITRLQDLYTIK